MQKRILDRYGSLREWRLAKDLTQAEAAQKFGATQSAWYKWEAGIQYPRRAMMRKLAERTGVPISVLAGVA